MHAAVAAAGLAKPGERRSWLMEHFKLGYGDANMVANFIGKPLPELGAGAGAGTSKGKTATEPVAEADPLDAIYAGAKAPLRPLHDAVMKVVQGFGDFESAPKKSYIRAAAARQHVQLHHARRQHGGG